MAKQGSKTGKDLTMGRTPLFTSSEITRKVDISLRQLYYWELKGLVKPQVITVGAREFKRYTAQDLELLRQVKYYLDEGYTLMRAFQKARQALALPWPACPLPAGRADAPKG